ncbi:hypothetical protein NG726_07710 [Pseudomonas sp. MOB-449]|nr:hypothetical protein [Pseudomonas sp. MOB-449]
MNRCSILAWTTLALLLAGPALANHCDSNYTTVQMALDNAANIEPNALEAAAALLPSALAACRQEEAQLASASADSTMLATDYVSLGQSMLINITDLLSGH